MDLLIEDGNPGAICVRAHFAQHGLISHCNFSIAQGFAGIYDVGIKMHNVSNWHFYALQTEDEKGEGPHCLPMEINHCTQLLFANYFIFRTVFVEQPCDTAIRVWDSRDITFRNLHNYTQMQYVFSNTLSDWSNFHPYFSRFGKRGLVVYTIDPDDPYRSMQQLLPQKRNDFAPQTINCTIMQRTIPCLRRSNFRSASPVWPEIP